SAILVSTQPSRRRRRRISGVVQRATSARRARMDIDHHFHRRLLLRRLRVDLVSDPLPPDAYDTHLHLLSLRARRGHDCPSGWRGSEGVKKFWLAALFLIGCRSTTLTDWTAYGHDASGTRHSPATQVTRENVRDLKVAWVYRTGDYSVGEGAARFENTPLLVDGTLYLTTPFGRVIALDPDTGVERWNYDPHIYVSGDYGDFANRGASAWRDPQKGKSDPCAMRIFVATIDSRL